MPVIFYPDDHKHWLSLRSKDITSTEVSALFDLNPYQTKYELYHQKSSRIIPEFEENERMKWGNRLEGAIARGVSEDNGWTSEPLKTYMRHSEEPRMGSSFDYKVKCPKKGEGIMEVKNVDSLIYRDKWTEDEAPEHIEIQLQHQLEVANVDWGCIVALVGGNMPVVIIRERDNEMGEALRCAVKQFWDDVEMKRQPSPNYDRDSDYIISRYQDAMDKAFDATSNHDYDVLCDRYQKFCGDERMASKRKKEAKAKILEIIKDNSIALSTRYKVSASLTKESKPKKITQDMVGEELPGRKSFRTFRITKLKKEN